MGLVYNMVHDKHESQSVSPRCAPHPLATRAHEASTYLLAVLLLMAWLRVVLLRLPLLLISLRLHAGLTMPAQHQLVSEWLAACAMLT